MRKTCIGVSNRELTVLHIIREPSGVQGIIKAQNNVKTDVVMANGSQKARGPQFDQTNMG